MRILHVIETLDPARGGPSSVVTRLAAAQAALGHEVRIVSYGNADAEWRMLQAVASVPGFGAVHRHLLPPADRTERLFGRRAGLLIRSLMADLDFIHLQGVWESMLRRAAELARRNGVPYCVQPAGMLDSWSMRQKPWKKRAALLLGYRRMLDEASFIHALNEDEVRLMTPLGLRAPSVIIPNGIFPEEVRLPEGGDGFRARVPMLGTRPFILFLSRLHYKKGLDILIDAFARLAPRCPEVDLVVAGPDCGALGEFGTLVERSGLSERVHIVGPIYGAEKLDALAEAACFCLPSRQEGFSVAILEALACGVPVVISDGCHFPDVSDAGAGIVLPLDPAAIADALHRVVANPESAARMGARGRDLVRQRYTWPQIADATIRAYTSRAVQGNRPNRDVPGLPLPRRPAGHA